LTKSIIAPSSERATYDEIQHGVGHLLVPDSFPSKTEIIVQVRQTLENALDSNDPLPLYVTLKAMEVAIKEGTAMLKENALGDFLREGQGQTKFEWRGVTLATRKTGRDGAEWKYPQDVVDEQNKLAQLDARKLELEDQIKAQQKIVKAKEEQAKMLQTAQLISPPSDGYGESLVVTFPR
jgi:hypothetical protein